MSLLRQSYLALIILIAIGCANEVPTHPEHDPKAVPVQAHESPIASPKERSIPSPFFFEIHSKAHVDFVFDTGATGRMLMVESTGGGAGWLDIDRDGNWDLLLIQGGDPLSTPAHPNGDRFYQNLCDSNFRDITPSTFRVDEYYGQGLTVGDYNNDGFDDVLITNVGPDVLLENQGDGTFLDMTAHAKVGDPRWGTSAAWADLDLDGDLDLFVCNYVKYDVHNPVACRSDSGAQSVCHPEMLSPEQSECYENLSDGRFRRMTEEWGLVAPQNKALGVVIADLNHDKQLDVFVANDTCANHFFMRENTGLYKECAVELGCAMNILGQYQANMGIGVGDYDHNGYLDLYVTHFTDDSNTLYANLGDAGFHDVTRVENLHKPTLAYLGFGAVIEDFNQDGAEEIFVTNGHIDDRRSSGALLEMPPQLFTFNGKSWTDQSSRAGDFFCKSYIGRGTAVADLENDGDLDMIVAHQGASVGLLRNDSDRGHWLQVELVGTASNRRAVGAIVEVTAGRQRYVKHLFAGGSYCSSHQPIATFGLGNFSDECSLTVRWPSGKWHTIQREILPDQRIVIIEEFADNSSAHGD